MRIHRHQQGTEAADAELPQTFRIELFEIHVLDRLDPGRLECRSATDDGKVSTANLAECSKALLAHAALAYNDPHAVALHQWPSEPLHAHRRRRADADRRVFRWILH